MSLPFGPPQPVSTLIRGTRYALLIAGVFYGLFKQKVYNSMEASWREAEAKRKIIRDHHNAILHAKIAKEEKET
ncbi:ATP synthase E chain, partial [Operophtera brumata]